MWRRGRNVECPKVNSLLELSQYTWREHNILRKPQLQHSHLNSRSHQILEMMWDDSEIEMGTFESTRNVSVNVKKIFEVM